MSKKSKKWVVLFFVKASELLAAVGSEITRLVLKLPPMT